ncbi:hypothetical protein [Alcaligenes faecalis]|uniref:hypothetical protein n=1 Tax=Alcaligenes aquatilis TaxID=323284 RepID=UPI002AA60D03|nr:hypothetical protein [Alcaligenes faecalis]
MSLETTEQTCSLWARFNDTLVRAYEADSSDVSYEMLMALITAQAGADMPERLYLAFEQFVVSAACLAKLQGGIELNTQGDWVRWGLAVGQITEIAQEVEIDRLRQFRECPQIYYWPRYEDVCVPYLSCLYDYSRQLSAFKEVCEAIWGESAIIYRKLMAQQPANIHPAQAALGSMMLIWAAKESPEIAGGLAQQIEAAISNSALPKSIRGRYCLCLTSNAGFLSSKSPVQWATLLLSDFADVVSLLDRVQAMVTTLRTDEYGREDAEAILAQMAVVREECSHGLTAVEAARNAAQKVQYVTPYFVRTTGMVAADLVVRGLQTWYRQGSDAEPLDPARLLISIPFGESGTTLLSGTEKREMQRDSHPPLERLSRKMMEFLGTYTTVTGSDNSMLPVPERLGFVREHMDGLLEALLDAYCPQGIEVPGDPICQLILPAEGNPIQATQIAAWGKTWPIASSLTTPRPDRKPKSVLIWQGGVYSGPMELDLVEAAFKAAGAEVTKVAPETSSSAEFLKEYENGNYDVLWVSSHGEFNHYMPHHVELRLAQDSSRVMLDDVWNRAPNSEERRLLVLNVCDGGRFVEPSLLPRIGLAAGLSCSTQATISHLWPVRLLPSAAFGACLAYQLAQGSPYFEAYCAAVEALRKSAWQIGADLEAVYGAGFQLIASLKASNDDFSGIETWGSAAFYQ